MLEVLIAEFNRDVRTKLDKKPSRSRRTIVAFDDDASNLPNFAKLLAATESWIERVELRNDEFQTAMEEPLEDPVLAQLQAMQASLDARFSTLEENVAALQRHPQLRDPGRPAQKGRPDFLPEEDYGCKLSEQGAKHGSFAASANVGRAWTGRNCSQLGASSGEGQSVNGRPYEGDYAQDAAIPKDRQIQKLPGLPQWEASGSSEEDGEAWSSSSKGGKGIEQVEKLKTTPREVPGENGTKNAACSGGIRVQQQCAVPVCEVHAGRKEPDRRLLHLGSWQRFTSC